jgi:tetratricopeptide (TPR) repeat protein
MNDSQAVKEEVTRLWQEAELYESQGLYDHALEVFQNILYREPENRKAQAKVVQVQFAQRMQDSSVAEAVTVPPDEMSPRVSVDLGLAYMGMNLYAEALEEFYKALKASPALRGELRRHLITCLIHLEEYDKVRQILTQVLDDPKLTLSERGDLIWEAVSAYVDKEAFSQAYDLMKRVPPAQREFIRDYDRIVGELEAGDLEQHEGDLAHGEEDDEFRIVDDSEDEEKTGRGLGGRPSESVEITASDLEPSIPLRTQIRYSRDNKNWHGGVSSKIASDWALLHVTESMNVGDDLVLQILLPSEPEYDSVWIISTVTKVYRADDDDGALSVKVKFDSFLPGGAAVLKSFVDKVVQEPSILMQKFGPAAAEKSDDDTDILFDSREEQAIRELEAELAGETGERDTVLLTVDDESREERDALSIDDEEAEFLPELSSQMVAFACKCGEPYSVPRASIGRTGRCGNCGSNITVPAVDTKSDSLAQHVIGKTVGGCRILYRIGGGGMGGVYKGHHLALDIPVAVKILHAHLAEKDPVFIKRFIREARSTARLQHPNIVGVMNVGFEDGLHYLIMPHVGGGNAASALAKEGRIDLERVLDIAIQISLALTLAEENNILHRDIKPANILFTEKGEAKLADLGLAKNYDSQESCITQTGIACGTPLYFSPEQAKGSQNMDIRSDIYSFGITLYHLTSGVPPFMGESAYVIFQKHVNEELPPFKDIDPPIPDTLFNLVRKMTAKKPEDRFSSAQELLDALMELREETFGTTQSTARKGILQRLGIKRPS